MLVSRRAVRRFVAIQHVLTVGGWAVVGLVVGRKACARSGGAPTWGSDAVSILVGLSAGAAGFVGFALGLFLFGLIVQGVGRLVRWLVRPLR